MLAPSMTDLLRLISLKPKQSLFQLIVQGQSHHASRILFSLMQQQLKCNCRISFEERGPTMAGCSDPRKTSCYMELQFIFCLVSQGN